MSKRPIKADDLLRFVFVGDPQISPDGKQILFAKKIIDEKKKYNSQLFTVSREGKLRQWTSGDTSAGQGRWSPKGDKIAFIADRDKGGAQIHFIPTDGGEARKVTTLPEGAIGEMVWSPDGAHIAFAFRERSPQFTKKAAKKREEEGGATPPVEIDDICYRLDGDSTFGPDRYKIYLLDVASGKCHKLYSGDKVGSYSFDWSPNSSELIVAHSSKAHPLIGPAHDQLYRLKLSGKVEKLKGLPKGDKGSPKWSPDGKWIAYAGDVDETDPWGVRNVKIYLTTPDGGEPKCLTGDVDFCMAVGTLGDTKEAGFGVTMLWAPDSKGIYVQIGSHGESQLGYVPLTGGVNLLTEGSHCLTLGNISDAGDAIPATWTDPVTMPEVAILDLKKKPLRPHLLTDFNKEFHAEVAIIKPSEHWIPSTDGVKVHTWVLEPTGKGPHAGVLEVHGGPHGQYGWTFFHEMQLLAAQGYVVVYSNPRGSKGYGEAFCGAIKGDWGNKDWDDVQAVTAWMQDHPAIDKKRIGIMGGSYGGYMTNWAIGHSKVYKAAITDRCVSNLISMSGNSDFPLNQDGYFGGVPWSGLEEIAPLWRQSPIAYFDKVVAPTLVIHSEGDLRCNIEQSEQVFYALQMRGIPSRFVRYPKETSHGMSRTGPPDLRLHRLGEIVSWWKKYL
jgi:dipeptidyl aminopeptidase/acylaminoacyl peptidase